MSTNAANTSTESLVPGSLVNSFIELMTTPGAPEEKLFVSHKAVDVPDRPSPIRWLSPTIDGLCRLPWHDASPPDGRKQLEEMAAARLLWLLCHVLDSETIPPTSIVPTWRGGVTAEWHVNGIDLEIESDPTGTLEYSFAGPGIEEYEGPVDNDLDNLREHVLLLPGERN